ncbi:multidrug ABC transporter ATP-binding protein [Cellulomonas algicola]|uniref:Multidrug ABC transporter ATP-binding protein n=1 Tax=Cellulomonas algicola TaxID=2071633 RepID=A0A401UVN8_9CELL|nr:ABC transporter ATP-binding protein [Cellulomonas algicola]GCD18755.1 multidrug ABC transporter ATP-binding protein [Cellulomonas algicola]
MGNNTPAVEVVGLRVVRGGRPVIDALDLAVPRRQVVGLLGPSGSGKTTLMRAIVGAQVVAGGDVLVLGEPAGAPSLRRRIGYVTQAPSVYSDLTVTENLRYAAAILGLGQREVDRALDEVDLTARAKQTIGTLSGGERSRVSLAIALLGHPELLVLDEPTVGLDPVLRRDLWDLFGRLRDAGASLLVSSHVMDEAVRCDRLVLMREGGVLADATLPELLAQTGAPDAEHAFLALVDAANAAAGPAGVPGATGATGRTGRADATGTTGATGTDTGSAS